jgi:hypothetical protein
MADEQETTPEQIQTVEPSEVTHEACSRAGEETIPLVVTPPPPPNH